MPGRIIEIFDDANLVQRIQNRLPRLFHQAEIESSRAGKIGMEVGSVRESIIIALLVSKFGNENVETDIPITQSEEDVKVFGEPLSIKTITSAGFGGVKLIWTVDPQKVREYVETYRPQCDMLLVQINWNHAGGLFYIPLEVQTHTFDRIGPNRYFNTPKPGTNPRGVEISGEALSSAVRDRRSRSIPILWQRSRIEHDKYRRWIDEWRTD